MTAVRQEAMELISSLPDVALPTAITLLKNLHIDVVTTERRRAPRRKRSREEMAAAIDKMRGGLADCADDRPYDEIRYEALTERYGLTDRH